jgi:hypothetical protein
MNVSVPFCSVVLTDSMKQSSSEADSHSASQEIPRLLWNPKFHYRVHNNPPAERLIASQEGLCSVELVGWLVS